jgi:Mn-dependent DtxR family transcriptional regulator
MDKEKALQAMRWAGKAVKTGDIARILGVGSKEVGKAIKELKTEERIESPKRCHYQPKN